MRLVTLYGYTYPCPLKMTASQLLCPSDDLDGSDGFLVVCRFPLCVYSSHHRRSVPACWHSIPNPDTASTFHQVSQTGAHPTKNLNFFSHFH